jgi:hypothetical protein
MNRLTLHFQTLPPWARRFVEQSGARFVKVMDPPQDNPFAGLQVNVIARTYMPDEASNELIWQGAQGARTWVHGWLPFYTSRPWVSHWELPNEPQPMWDQTFRHALDDFTAEAVYLMAERDLRAVGLNFGVGWPDVLHAPDFAQALEELRNHDGLLGVHEYCAPCMLLPDHHGTHWYTLRIRHTLHELDQAAIPCPPVFIGECGIDGGVTTPANNPPMPLRGWRTYAGHPREYLRQLASYDQNLPPQVLAAAIFNAGSLPPWFDFDVDEGLAMQLARYIRSGELPT